jgi:hypothetical protein
MRNMEVANNVLKLPRPAKMPLGIKVILLEDRSLFVTFEWSKDTFGKEYKKRTVRSSCRDWKMCRKVVMWCCCLICPWSWYSNEADVHCATSISHKQCGQAAESSEGAVRNRCDLVVKQAPVGKVQLGMCIKYAMSPSILQRCQDV